MASKSAMRIRHLQALEMLFEAAGRLSTALAIDPPAKPVAHPKNRSEMHEVQRFEGVANFVKRVADKLAPPTGETVTETLEDDAPVVVAETEALVKKPAKAKPAK